MTTLALVDPLWIPVLEQVVLVGRRETQVVVDSLPRVLTVPTKTFVVHKQELVRHGIERRLNHRTPFVLLGQCCIETLETMVLEHAGKREFRIT